MSFRPIGRIRAFIRVCVSAACLAAVALMGAEPLRASGPWIVGDVVICVGSGQCRVYSPAGALKMTLSVPTNPKQDTGGVVWSSVFDLYAVDSRNKQVLRFNRSGTHAASILLTTAGRPGPLALDSSGTLYVGIKDSGSIVKRTPDGGTVVIGGLPGNVQTMDLADDHKSMWYGSLTRTINQVDVTPPGASIASYTLDGPGQVAGIRLLPLRAPFDGSGAMLIADMVDVKLVRIVGTSACVVRKYDRAAEDGWRTVTLEPDGIGFLAGTTRGDVFRFAIGDIGSGPCAATESVNGTTARVIATASTGLSGMTVKGGAQLNVRPLNFVPGTNVQRDAIFGNPLVPGSSAASFPRHAMGVMVRQLTSASNQGPFTLVVSNVWTRLDGACTDRSDPSDYECRTTSFAADTPPSPRCIPYVTSDDQDCVFYRFEDEATTVPAGVNSATFITSIDFTPNAAYTPPACTGSSKGNPRMLRDPDPVPDPDPNGPYLFSQDITIGITRVAGQDPIFGEGTGRGGSDYGAFDRCLPPDFAQVVATINKPTEGSLHLLGRSIPFEVSVVNQANGQDITNAVDEPNGMTLFIRHDEGETYLNLNNPGSSPSFFTKKQVKSGKTTRTVYSSNWDSTQTTLTGGFVACVSSIDLGKGGAGQFAPVCVSFSLRR